MNGTRIAGWMLGSIPFSTVWLVGVNLPQGDPGPFVQAAALFPQMVAVTALLLQAAAEPAVRAPQPVPQPRRAVPAAAVRRELHARRRELSR